MKTARQIADDTSDRLTALDGIDPSDTPSAEAAPEFHTVGYEEFTPHAPSVAEVRRFVRRVLEDAGLTEDSVTACELIADELATNALVYAGSSIQ